MAAPALRIEAEMHAASITHISADQAGRLALTVSLDKTARLWEAETGRLVRVLRVPSGAGNEGKLYAGALSPDGRLAAVAGWTGSEWDGTFCIYLFETASGRLTGRLTRLPNVVHELAFSPAGRWLAAGMASSGARIFDLAANSSVSADNDYGEGCHGLAWDGDHRLATTCFDGRMRLYEWPAGEAPPQKLKPVKISAFPAGRRPFGIHFSPGGERVAVGFDDAGAVAVLAGADLSPIFVPTAGKTPGSLATVAWSADGETLAAAGVAQSGAYAVRLWAERGHGAPRDVLTAQSTIMNLWPLGAGGFLFAAADPAWGKVDPSAKVIHLGASPLADYRVLKGAFQLSPSGEEVAFSYEAFAKSPATFDLRTRLLHVGRGGQAQRGVRVGPRTTGLKITGWADSNSPKLDGLSIPLQPHERSRSCTVAGDGTFFLLGTDWYLRAFAASGEERWRVAAPEAAWAVNSTADARLAVAACGDGTIRWHQADDGRELLSFFPHADRRRWVLWTPQGYYDCSPGGEDLIGWQVNRGKDQAPDFFPAARFRAQLYRPDLVARALQSDDRSALPKPVIAGAAAPAPASGKVIAATAPPVVELMDAGPLGEVTVPDGSARYQVRYRVRRTSREAIAKVRILADGRPLKVDCPLPPDDATVVSAEVELPAGNCVLSLLADTQSGVASVPATVRIARRGRPAADAAPLKPTLYVLAVGVADLKINDPFDRDGNGRVTEAELAEGAPAQEQPFADLHYADSDAREIAATLARQEGLLYAAVRTRVLVNGEATASAIRDGLEWIKTETTARDVAMVFFSGHGENDQEGRYSFPGYEYDPRRRMSTAVSFTEIEQSVRDPAGKLIFFIDTCHAGNALGKLFTRKGAGPDINRLLNELSSAENGAVVFASSTGRQQSLESVELQHGIFAQAIIEGLEGKADVLGYGRIDLSGLEAYVCHRVKEISEGRQTPTVAKPQTIPDFPLALKLP